MNEAVDATSADGDKQLGLTPEEARVMMSDPHSPVGKDNQQGFGNSPGGGLGSHPSFDALINHPGYISHVKEFVNGEQTAFTAGGSVMQRWPGQASGAPGFRRGSAHSAITGASAPGPGDRLHGSQRGLGVGPARLGAAASRERIISLQTGTNGPIVGECGGSSGGARKSQTGGEREDYRGF